MYSRCVDVGGSGAGWRPLHRVILGVGVASNRRRVRNGWGRCPLNHGRRMARRRSGSVACFWVALEIRVVATVFSRIVNRFDRRMGAKGLGRDSHRVSGDRRLRHTIRVIHSSSRGRIRLDVPVRWIPMVVVHRVGVVRIAPGGGRIVGMVGVGNERCLLPRCGRLRGCRDRGRGFQGSSFVLMDCGIWMRRVERSATGITMECVP
jgi:hypothetical protein